MAKCLINSKALEERTVYPCFSIKQQSEEGAVDARVAQVPGVGPVGAGAACCPHLCNGDHGQWGVKPLVHRRSKSVFRRTKNVGAVATAQNSARRPRLNRLASLATGTLGSNVPKHKLK